jgi:basic membrane protein A and related proteins
MPTKRIFAVLMILVLIVLPALASCAPKQQAPAQTAAPAAEKKLKIALVLQGTKDDGTWNAMAWEGAQKLKEMGYEIASSESVSDADVARVLRNYANEGYDLIWAHSGTYPNAVMEVAKEFPKVSFAVPTSPDLQFPANVWRVTHEWEDAYFMAGCMAGLLTKTNVVGNVGGIPIPIYVASATAFNQGVKYSNPNAKTFDPVFVGDFNDSVGGKKAATAQIESGADIVISSMDAGTFGVIEAAREANKSGKAVHTMTILSDLYNQAPDVVYSSAYMDYPGAVIAVAQKVASGEKGGYYPMSWSKGNARWADLHGQVPADVLAKVKQCEQDVTSGKVKVFLQADLPKQ